MEKAIGIRILSAAALMVLLASAGCGPPPRRSDTDLASFEKAGPVRFTIDYKQVLQSRKSGGPYCLVSGDLLELQMPAVVNLLPNRQGDETEPYRCRLDGSGRIVLPIVGNLEVAGKTLPEVEAAIAALYYPDYVLQEPSIVATVSEYISASVSVVGAVKLPGVYELRSNEQTLTTALMKAGGIADDGAATIYISGAGIGAPRSVTVPVVNMNIPGKDVELIDGDAIIVEATDPKGVSVVGLVKKPGMYPWKSQSRCTVMDAIAFAGGVNDLADPQYARVYRQDSDGKIVSAVVKLNESTSADAGEVCLKSGDIIVVEQTPRTRTRLVLSQVVRMGLGVNAGASVGP